MAEIVIKGGRLLDVAGERSGDVVIGDDGMVVAVGPDLDAPVVVDAGGCVVAPGLVDLHTHLREPGKEEAETVESGSRAAVLGGFTCVVAMPNTDPPIDDAAMVREVQGLGRASLCDVEVAGAITVGRKGERLAPMGEMADLGVRFFTDDGSGVQDERLMRRAFEYAAGLGVTIAQHCEVDSLASGGHMHEGVWSSRLGIPGIPAEAEELMVMRDIALARMTGARVHFQHLSTAGSVAMVRAAKAGGLAVSAEAATHHFTLTDACLASFDSVFKVNPPLRTDSDVAAVKAALAEGTIDCIATDHAPHTADEKNVEFDFAPFGIVGLETALAVTLETLVDRHGFSLAHAIDLLTRKPARILGLPGGSIEEGAPGDLVLFDPAARWTASRDHFYGRSHNSPWLDQSLKGRVRRTLVGGRTVFQDGVIAEPQ